MSRKVSFWWGWLRGGLVSWDRPFVLFLAAAIIVTIGLVAYTTQTPRAAEKFTEFYILGAKSNAVSYPRDVVLEESEWVIVGIVNWEQGTTIYRMEIDIDGQVVEQMKPLTLKYKEKWEQVVSLTATKLGLNQKVEFRLYRGEESDPYRTLNLWLDVRERG